MTSIINELWYGNICLQEDGILDMPDIKELLGYIARHQADLEAILTDKQKNLLEKLMYNRIEFDSLAEAAILEYGFKLGAKMILAVTSERNTN